LSDAPIFLQKAADALGLTFVRMEAAHADDVDAAFTAAEIEGLHVPDDANLAGRPSAREKIIQLTSARRVPVVQWGLERTKLLSPMLETTNMWLGAGILAAAGLWQLTPIKRVCLQHCRSPLSFLLGRWRPGRRGAFRMGLEHGAYCLGCCWFLMALLFFGGVMNLYWIAGLAVFVLLEKTLPLGHWVGRLAGVLLILGAGALVLRTV
jgi:hypothetical protein